MAFDEIHDEELDAVYRKYLKALHTQEKIEALYNGVKKIFSKLHLYLYDKNKFKEKSDLLIKELENLLDRYYYHDKLFTEKILFEAKAYIIELNKW